MVLLSSCVFDIGICCLIADLHVYTFVFGYITLNLKYLLLVTILLFHKSSRNAAVTLFNFMYPLQSIRKIIIQGSALNSRSFILLKSMGMSAKLQINPELKNLLKSGCSFFLKFRGVRNVCLQSWFT